MCSSYANLTKVPIILSCLLHSYISSEICTLYNGIFLPIAGKFTFVAPPMNHTVVFTFHILLLNGDHFYGLFILQSSL